MELYEQVGREFVNGNYTCDLNKLTWTQAFTFILREYHDLDIQKDKVHLLWTENGGHLRRKLSNDKLLLNVLKLTMPTYSGNGLVLYRGECHFLYQQNKIGFCWTPLQSVAEAFASGLNAIESGGVLLKAYAPTPAILSAPNKHSSDQMGEFEYTCDPNLLENIKTVQFFKKIES
ncbi:MULTISPECIES: hypothetical protein [unclassified Pseudoalteromonas]|uniref:hypothetical protein n=1 Tax=unclassified Pseudoalteromonas TaxID=194690 RepID=UPI0004A296FF|nr:MULTISPECIES: hypothetical protein [unclassified Pseudoalteromonas]MDC9496228.1 hypothetical protein [Pseudoalteromonas sp. Angola-20]MDC9515808.1 hypothetical protein [Pseudoalteromonas sp. Angola-22]MDC9531991.1 hypothetical protein [Pseudoalteromonas sp. Angola-9]TMP80264.1 hypothetical protein CWB71_14255 [Pseudoalteromonas sp. S983]|tara:strand:- start:181 stop:705 length:525 start_codon:yes stop_codon:yes gene_type:complete